MTNNAKPTAIKIPRLLSDVAALNNSMAPTSPRNNVAVPRITRPKDTPGVISGKKRPQVTQKLLSSKHIEEFESELCLI